MKTLLLLCCSILLFGACAKKLTPVSDSISWIVNDSTNVSEVARIDTVYIPGDTVRLVEQIDCDKVTNKPVVSSAKAKSGRANISVTVDKNGKLTATAACDSLLKEVEVRDKEIYRLRNEAKKEVTVTVEYRTRRIDIWCRYIVGGLLLLIAGYVFAKIKKFIP